jgi:hypothetical protein
LTTWPTASEALDSDHAALLTEALSVSIASTAAALDLHPGRAPSSTVSIVRRSTTVIDVLVLGDSTVYVAYNGKIDRLRDNRLALLDLPSRTRLFERLAAGHGYNDHRRKELARQMTGEKRRTGTVPAATGSPKLMSRPARTAWYIPIPHTTSRGAPYSLTELTNPPLISASPWKI